MAEETKQEKSDVFVEYLEKTVSRLWHLGLLVASFYVAAHPELAYLAPLIQTLAQASNPVK